MTNGSNCPSHKPPLPAFWEGQRRPPCLPKTLTNPPPAFTLCPRCYFPLDPQKYYKVDFSAPARLPPPPSTMPADHTAIGYRGGEGAPIPPPTSTESVSCTRRYWTFSLTTCLLLQEQPRDVASLPGSSPTRVGSPASPVHGKERCSSAASTEYSFSDRFSFNSEYEAVLEQTEALYFPRKEHMPASPPTSSPSTESSLIPSTSGEPAPLPAGRRWVAFRGRIPGVYTSSYVLWAFPFTPSNADDLHSVDATEQTEGFPNAFKLAFEDTAHANHAWNKFLEDGTIPAHGRGPWVVFVGRRQGVFTS